MLGSERSLEWSVGISIGSVTSSRVSERRVGSIVDKITSHSPVISGISFETTVDEKVLTVVHSRVGDLEIPLTFVGRGRRVER